MVLIPDGSGNTQDVAYPLALMREVANDILTAVRGARQQHGDHWHVVQQYFSQCEPTYKPVGIAPKLDFAGGDVASYMKDILNPHAQRLTTSYDWLEKFAHTLLDAANQMEQTDQTVQSNFTNNNQ